MSALFLSTQAPLEFNQIKEELIAVFVVEPDTDFSNKVLGLLEPRKAELAAKNIKVLLVTHDSNKSSASGDYILDSDKSILNQASEIFKNKTNPGENLVLFKRTDNSLKYLVHKENPEHEYDWITVVSDFADNYFNPSPNDQNLYKWGQVVPEDGDYLCVDCGYIASFVVGDIFPVCEVCLSGEPAGPTSSDGAYWEKV